MSDIFISYASEDLQRIRPLAQALEAKGWSVFWDRTIPAGKTWRQVIGEALDAARCVIVAWSNTSVASRWVQEEADRGLEREILVPVLIDDVRPPLGFSAIQAQDLTNWDQTHQSPEFEKLVVDMAVILGPPPIKVPEVERRMAEAEEKRKAEEEEAQRKAEEKKAADELDAKLSAIRMEMLEAKASHEIQELSYRVDEILAKNPHLSEARMLKSQLSEALEVEKRRAEEPAVVKAAPPSLSRFLSVGLLPKLVGGVAVIALTVAFLIKIDLMDTSKEMDTSPGLSQEQREAMEEGRREAEKLMLKAAEEDKSKEAWKEPLTGMEFVRIPGGCYEMGDNFGDGERNEKPVHTVCMDDFYLSRHEVTVGAFRTFTSETGYKTEAEKGYGCYIYVDREWKLSKDGNWKNPGFTQTDRHPVTCVSWNDTQSYINWLKEKTGKEYSLPTEAEWEYAARSGGKKEKWAGTSSKSDLKNYAWYWDNSGKKTHPVGRTEPNGQGLYDMSGNVWEWVNDWYDENYYSKSPEKNPKGPTEGNYKVLRGGSWNSGAGKTRTTKRGRSKLRTRKYNFGFRLALSPQ